jgi:hypothetical protein
MRGVEWGRMGWVSTWTSRMPFSGWVWKQFVRSMATCSTFTNGSLARTHILSRCGSIRPPTIRWEGFGWTTTSCRPSPGCL